MRMDGLELLEGVGKDLKGGVYLHVYCLLHMTLSLYIKQNEN